MKIVWICGKDTVTDDWKGIITRIHDSLYFPVIRRVEMTDQDFLHCCVMNQDMFDKVLSVWNGTRILNQVIRAVMSCTKVFVSRHTNCIRIRYGQVKLLQ